MLSELGSGAKDNMVGVGAFRRVVLVDDNDAVVLITTDKSLALMAMPPTLLLMEEVVKIGCDRKVGQNGSTSDSGEESWWRPR